MSDKSFISFHGGVGSATGANFLFSITCKDEVPLRVLVDCGLFQGTSYATEENGKVFSYDPSSVDYLFVTHAHADHIGRVPKLVKEGFRGQIISTPETKALSELMFADALNIMRHEASDKGTEVAYDESHVIQTFALWREVPYHETVSLRGGVSVVAKDAGHILGSAFFEFTREGKKVVFSGDLGNTPSLLIRDTEPLENAHYLLIESVYGDRNHENRETRRRMLRDAVLRAVQEKGVLIIPAFSLERSQIILYELNNMVEDNEIPSIPVFLDSPLAIKVTALYRRLKDVFKESVKKEIAEGDDIFNFPRLRFTSTRQESSHIDQVENPKIIIAGGGMSEGGRVIGHEQNYLPDPRNTVLLVGYQAAGTLGRRLLEGEKEVVITGRKVRVAARIMSVTGYSSHKDSDHLVEFVSNSAATLRKVFVAMGEPKSSLFLAQRLKEELGVESVYPELGSIHEIEF